MRMCEIPTEVAYPEAVKSGGIWRRVSRSAGMQLQRFIFRHFSTLDISNRHEYENVAVRKSSALSIQVV